MLENIDLVWCQYTELRDFSVSMLSCLEAEAEKVDGWIGSGAGDWQSRCGNMFC